MELLKTLFSKKKVEKQKTVADYQREKLITFGREQFQKMMKLGIGAPVSLT
jgi:hypothetical protein